MLLGAADESSPTGRNSGEVEVTEFPPLSCHLLATCAQLREAAWAGKGSKRGSGLLLLAQERSQQLQACCEVMPGAAHAFLQVETDSGRVGWQPQPWRTHEEQYQSYLLCLSPSSPGLRGLELGCPIPFVPSVPVPPKSAFHWDPWVLGRIQRTRPTHPWSTASLPRCCGLAKTGSEGAREEPAGA